MLVKKYRSEVISIKNFFKNIYTVEFRSLIGRYKYNPGQFLHLTLDQDYDGSGQWPESRCFSMQSNPNEENIKITFSVKGHFTKQMEQHLKVNSIVWLKLPYGELFGQKHNKTNTIFIAGGTGITPFLSLFSHNSFNEYINPKIYLGFRSREYNIYKEELNKISTCEDIKISYEESDGLIDINEVYYGSNKNSDYFISGPPTMIKSFKQKLIDMGVPRCNVLTDEWE